MFVIFCKFIQVITQNTIVGRLRELNFLSGVEQRAWRASMLVQQLRAALRSSAQVFSAIEWI